MNNPEDSFLPKSAYENPETGDLGLRIKNRIIKNGGIYSETLIINPDETLSLNNNRTTESVFTPFGFILKNKSEFYKFAQELQELYPFLHFQFESSIYGDSITCKISLME